MYSLTPGSPTLVGGPAALSVTKSPQIPFIFIIRSAASLGLLPTDNVDAAICHDLDGDVDTVPNLIDNCPAVGNPTQVDTDADFDGDACDLDDDDDGVFDVAEGPEAIACGGDPLDAASRPERVDPDFAGVSDDGDLAIDEALPPGAEAYDCDGDGWTGSQEALIYPSPITVSDQDPCGAEWPSNLAAPAANVLNISDVLSFTAPPRLPADFGSGGAFNMFGHDLDDDGDTVIETTEDPGAPGGPMFNVARWNLQLPPHLAATTINIGDLNSLFNGVIGSGARPPMFSDTGAVAFFTGGGMCPWPP
jgi:hypothetical protein